MRSYPRWFGLILASILLSGCAANNEPEINPTTGMPKILCGVKPILERANKKVLDLLAIKTSIESTKEAMLEVMTAGFGLYSTISFEPASTWMSNVQSNSTDFYSFLNAPDSFETDFILVIFSDWKKNYAELATYCP